MFVFHTHVFYTECFNTLRPRQNGHHFADDILKCISLNAYVSISIENSLNFVHMCPVNNIPASVQIMAWHRPGDKPLSESMMVRLSTHICVCRAQWVNTTKQRFLHRNYLLDTIKSFTSINYLTQTLFYWLPFFIGNLIFYQRCRAKLIMLPPGFNKMLTTSIVTLAIVRYF